MFAGFTLARVGVGPVRLRVRHGGSGPPVVLLHGHPRTHATWHRVAPLLAERFTVICPDLRGYGGSSKPPGGDDHSGYAKRAMAADVVGLLDALGHDRAAVVGHDRGCYVAMRTALDHPDRVSRLGVLDGVPIGEALARCDARFAARWWHWFFLGQSAKPAERVINADPDAWYGGSPEQMGAEAYADYRRAIHDPATVHAMCEDYRAGLGPDRAADDADRAAGRQIGCPTLFCWSQRDDMVDLYGDPAAIWRQWAPDLRVASIDSGHHMAEEAPQQLAAVLGAFLSGGAGLSRPE
ncbi:alpha/beta hydrolase [Micromonospora sp. KC213]|uniref:alpha/beta fold hydrolase n=1 Tax=Micromonospora sp. KC213 TaxID=2530378 RepID=UPI00105086D4|nr:alpha/beta hydrolase [Micromonospora sp. KC213]TDC31189.1 alpha/beta hydrolase [Micromonospora sp. KC213]